MRRQTSYNSAHIQSRSNSRILSVPRLTKIKKAPRKCCPKSSYLVCVVLLALSISWLNIERTNGETSSEAKKLHAEISASAIVPKSNVVAKVDVDLAESEEAKDQNNFFIPLYHRESYEKEIKLALKPLESAVNTTAAYKHQFWSGFCNQRMMFLGVLFLAQDTNSTQILVESIKWKGEFFSCLVLPCFALPCLALPEESMICIYTFPRCHQTSLEQMKGYVTTICLIPFIGILSIPNFQGWLYTARLYFQMYLLKTEEAISM